MTADFQIDRVVPWGRHRAEYLAFFDLLNLEPGPRLLDCAAGPSSFNAEMTELGFDVISTDPLYGCSKSAIAQRIAETKTVMMAAVEAAADRFVWDRYGTPEGLERTRLSAMKLFLEDFEEGLVEGRYLDASLPDLPFDDGAFDLALSSHFLLLYSRHLDLAFHEAAALEMLRVAAEVRVYPLLELESGLPSQHLEPLMKALGACGYVCKIRTVGFEFLKGGNEMLRVLRT